MNYYVDECAVKIAFIQTVRFTGRQNIKWNKVEDFAKSYINKSYQINESADTVYIGSDFPSEIKGSSDTCRLKGSYAKAKANAVTIVPELLALSSNKRWQENYKGKHKIDARYGWYRYTSRFAFPIHDADGTERFNIYRIEMLVRVASDGKLFLYDMVNIKKEKETGTPH